VKVGDNKKKKKSPQAVELIISSMLKYFRLYKIKSIYLLLGCRVGIHIHTLIKELVYGKIKIIGYSDRRLIAHMECEGEKKDEFSE